MTKTMKKSEIPAGLETLSDKPKRWDFSRDAGDPRRLTAWGAELACASALVAPLADIPWEAGAAAGVVCTGAAVIYEKAKGSWRRVTVARASSWLATTAGSPTPLPPARPSSPWPLVYPRGAPAPR